MIQAKWIPGNENISECLTLRRAVFVSELELASDEKDWIDEYALHALVYDNDAALATGRIYGMNQGILKIDCVCVAPDKRGGKLGDLIMRMLLFKAQELGAAWIVTDTCQKTKGFFIKYGFASEGKSEKIDSADIHLKLAAKDIKLSCKGCQDHA